MRQVVWIKYTMGLKHQVSVDIVVQKAFLNLWLLTIFKQSIWDPCVAVDICTIKLHHSPYLFFGWSFLLPSYFLSICSFCPIFPITSFVCFYNSNPKFIIISTLKMTYFRLEVI